jgi:hypothetical protein
MSVLQIYGYLLQIYGYTPTDLWSRATKIWCYPQGARPNCYKFMVLADNGQRINLLLRIYGP